MDVTEIQRQIDVLIRDVKKLNAYIAARDRRRRISPNMEPPIPPQQCIELDEKWWLQNAQPLVDGIRELLNPHISPYFGGLW
jgi:hypothetical protein